MRFLNRLHLYRLKYLTAILSLWSVAIALGYVSESAAAQDSVCVRVKIEIEQTVTLERQAFRATMKVNKGGESELTGFRVAVNFLDEQGNAVSATSNANDTPSTFFYRLTGSVVVPNRIDAGESEELVWLIIPAPAAGDANQNGVIHYDSPLTPSPSQKIIFLVHKKPKKTYC